MDIYGKFKAVTEESLYDFYGLASLEISNLTTEEQAICDSILQEMKGTYSAALLKRFAYWSPNGGKAMTVEQMIETLKDSLKDEVAKQARNMGAMGKGFDMMSAVKMMRGETGDSKENLKKKEDANVKQFAEKLSTFDKSRYPAIAKGVIQLHEAKTSQDIILAIDYLNDQQHWGGYILIDFVAGHRDPSDPEGNRVLNQIMEIKKNAVSPLAFADKMSSDVRKLVQQNQRLLKAGVRGGK